MKAIQNDYRDSKEVRKAETKLKSKDTRKDKEYKIQELKSSENVRFSQMSTFVDCLEEEEYENMKALFMQSVEANMFFKKVFDTRGFEDKIIQIQRFKFVEMKKAEEIDSDSSASS